MELTLNYMIDNPNVILIFADDLGRGMLSCYGQLTELILPISTHQRRTFYAHY